jgi:hypothetical protein
MRDRKRGGLVLLVLVILIALTSIFVFSDLGIQTIGDGTYNGELNLTSADIKFNGITADDDIGKSLLVTDLNGDNLNDIIIGVPNAIANWPTYTAAGKVYIYYGALTSSEYNLSSADLELHGKYGTYYGGGALTSGDINNDGYQDLVVSAVGARPDYPSDSTTYGEFYLFYGPISRTGALNLTDANVTFRGIDEQDFYTSDVNQILYSADVNNDSFDDIIIGAQKADPNGNADSGETYIIYGGNSLTSIYNLTYANVTLNGVNAGDFSGSEVSSGDINGDGISDILITAESGDNGHTDEGQTYVVFGANTLNSEINLSDANVTIDGVTSSDFSGTSISTGDINNDGYDDIVIGAEKADANSITDAGQAYIIYGSSTISGTIELDDANVTFNGIAETDYAGHSTSVTDLNLDGYSDVIISSYLNNASSNADSGQVYVVYGSANLTSIINLSDANITYNGINSSDYAGFALITGDTNNDGFPDLLIGAYGADPASVSSAGEIYVIESKITCNVINENFTLNQNINANGDCFTINGSNIIIEGNGYTITGNGSGTGINLSGVENVTIKNVNLDNFSNAMNFQNNANFNNIYNVSLSNSTSFDVLIPNSGGTNNILTNVSFNQSSVSVGSSSNFFVKWYANIYVNDSEGNDLTNVNISIYNTSNLLETSGLTSSNGILTLALTEYQEDSLGKTYHTNHTVNITKALYGTGSENINLSTTNNTNLFFTLSFGCGQITENITFSPTTYSSNGTCFTLGADNLVVDASGLTIIGNGSGDGINLNGYNNFAISNILIRNFSNGVNLVLTNNSYFYNSDIINSTSADILVGDNAGYNNTFINTTFNKNNISVGSNTDLSTKWYVDITVNNTGNLIENATVYGYNVSGGLDHSNTTNSNGTTQLTLTEFVQTNSGKTYFTPHNITATKTGYVNSIQNINLTGTNSTSINMNIFGNVSCVTISESINFQTSTINVSGTCFTIGASNIIINGNNSVIIGDSTGYGFNFNNKNNVTVTGFNVSNFSMGVYLTESSNNTFSDFHISNSGSYGAYFYATSTTNNFSEGSIINSASYDIYLADAVAMDGHRDQDIYLTNFTINKSSIYAGTDATLTNKWYVDITVDDNSDNLLPSVNVTAYKADGAVEDSQLTVATGDTGTTRLTISEFLKDEYGYTYITPHNINVYKAGYLENSSVLAVDETNNTQINYTLQVIVPGMNLTANATLSENMNINGTLFTLMNDNITINGGGYTITGNGSGSAFILNNRTGITINNIELTNFTSGVNLYNSNDSTITNSIIYNNTYGVMFNESNDNTVSNSILDNNTHSNVFAINTGYTNNTILNSTISIDEINVSGTATVFLKWYVTTNVTFGDLNYPLPNANVTGYFNSTGNVDYSGLTNSEGLVNLELSELKKNATGVTYLTPHNVSAYFNSSFGYSANETSLNLSTTNSTQINLSLNLSCTAPSNDLEINESISLCPGTFEINDLGSPGVLRILTDNVTVTCSDTIIKGTGSDSGIGIYVNDAVNVTIIDCQIEDYLKGISLTKSTASCDNFTASGIRIDGTSQAIEVTHNLSNFNLTNFNLTNTGVYGIFSNAGPSNSFISNGFFSGSGSEGIRFVINNASNFTINNVTFDTLSRGITLSGNNFIIRNNTFSNSGYGIFINLGTDNSIYYNTFEDATFYHAYVLTDGNNFNTSVNVSGTMSSQGNSWDDYCSLTFTDSNSDGYANSGSSYPYNSSNGGSVFGYVNDYGPMVISCPSSTPSGSGGGSSSSGGGAVTTTEPTVENTVKKSSNKKKTEEPIVETETLIVDITNEIDNDDTTIVTFSLKNNGNETLELNSNIEDTPEEPFFILKAKTLGYEGSFFNKLSGISYSANAVNGNLLKTELAKSETLKLEPGESKEVSLEITRPELSTKDRTVKVVFKSLDGDVFEKEINLKAKAITGTMLDLNTEENTFDIYLVISPGSVIEEQLSNKGGNDNLLTGASVFDSFKQASNAYTFELSINKLSEIKENRELPVKMKLSDVLLDREKTSQFSDIYGPYFPPKGQNLLFAQQLKYDPEKFNGDYEIQTKIIFDKMVVSENKFDVVLE